MSGLEVVGVVLGLIPLAISALEHYESSLEACKVFARYEGYLEETRDEFRMEQAALNHCLRLVLADLVSTRNLESMISSPENQLWKDEKLRQLLINKLGIECDILFMGLVKKIQQQINTLKESLPNAWPSTTTKQILQPAEQRPAASDRRQRVMQLRERTKYTLKRSTINNLLKNIAECNIRLQSLTNGISKEKGTGDLPSHINRPRASMEIPLNEIQENAGKVYHVLAKAWRDCVHQTHCAYLLLERRICMKSGRTGREDKDQDAPPKFRLCFQNPTEETWEAGEVSILTRSAPIRDRKVKIIHPQSSDAAPGMSQDKLDLEEPLPKSEIVNNLCKELHRKENSGNRFEFDLDPDGLLRELLPKRPKPPTPKESSSGPLRDYLSLAQIIAHKGQQRKDQPRWTAKDRYTLSVIIASSFLQLHQTAWSESGWNAHRIVFEKPSETTKKINVSHPYLTKTMHRDTQQSGLAHKLIDPKNHRQPQQDCQSLLVLAEMLLEIRLESSMAEMKRDMKPGKNSVDTTDVETLRYWMEEEEGNLSYQLRDAVLFCIQGSVFTHADLSHWKTRQEILKYVVFPLQDELDIWEHGLA